MVKSVYPEKASYITPLAIKKLKSILPNYLTTEQLKLFFERDVPLNKLGVCTATTLLIDKELSTIHEGLCILAKDTLDSFISDIEREYR